MNFSTFLFSVLLASPTSYAQDQDPQRQHLRQVCMPEVQRLCPEAATRFARRECVRVNYERLSAACKSAVAATPWRQAQISQ